MDSVRSIQEHLYMSDQDYHEPSEGYAGVHIAQQLVSFPKLDMEEAVTEPVPYVLQHDLRIDQGPEETYLVFLGELKYYADSSYYAPA